jgi:hypothetical protein
VDCALALVDASSAERDELNIVRQLRVESGGAEIIEATVRDVVNAAAKDVTAAADLPATGARVTR